MKSLLSHGSIATSVALLCVSLIALPTLGCPSQTQLANLTSILGTSAASVAAIQGNITLSQKLTADTSAAVTAVTNWKSGTPAQQAIEALNLVEDDLSLFPQTSQYAPLIVLAIGTTQSILALLPPPTSSGTAKASHQGLTLAHPPKNADDFKNQWNAIVAQNPSLAQARIQ